MARDSVHVAAPPDRVFAVLADPWAYGEWVVGTAVVGADDHWPQPGSSLRYEIAAGPLRLWSDRTLVVGAHPPRRLDLLVRTGRLPATTVRLELAEADHGTRVTLDERPAQRLLDAALGPAGHLAASLRNRRALARLKRLVEREGRG